LSEGKKLKPLNKRLIGVLVLIFIIITSTAAVLYIWNSSATFDANKVVGNYTHDNKSSINSTSNTVNNKTSPSGKKNHTTAHLIDSGNSYGYDDYYWNSKYVNNWKTYAHGTKKVVIYVKWTFTDAKKEIKQIITIREDPDNSGMAFVEIVPKMSGISNWETWTYMQGNRNSLKFYWNSFRKSGLKDGYWS
jgi:hypothetical protein